MTCPSSEADMVNHDAYRRDLQRKYCNFCNSRGYIIVPTFSEDFGKGTESRPCPVCSPEPSRWGSVVAVAIILAGLIALRFLVAP